MSRWVPLDLARPMAHLREVARGVDGHGYALLSQAAAGALLGLPPTPGTVSTVSTGERRGAAVQYQKVLERAEAYGLELEIRVRPK